MHTATSTIEGPGSVTTEGLCTGEAHPHYPEAAKLAWQHSYFAPEEIDAFNLPLYQRLGSGRMFVAAVSGRFNVDRLLEAHGTQLWRGAQLDEPKRGRRWETSHRQLLFELQPDLFLFVNSNAGCLRVFARDRTLAERTARALAERFTARRRQRSLPSFHLLSICHGLVETELVEEQAKVRRTTQEIALLYGEEFMVWQNALLSALRAKTTGTVILRGEPGVGKTSFIRHVLACLKRTHRFYYLPTSSFGALTSPELVDFWQKQAVHFPQQQKVVLLEDAEALLAEREAGNRAEIANLLNIADGLLGDFLQMKLICTVNCPLEHLDPAIVRSGRLLAAWEFKRVPRERAQRIAEAHGLTLRPQEDYTLAEIFHGSAKALTSVPRRPMGFGAPHQESAAL